MNSAYNNYLLVNFAHTNQNNHIFPYGYCDIDTRIINVLVCDHLAGGDKGKSKRALYQLSQVNQCASVWLDNSSFFKKLFDLQSPLLVGRKFEFSLFLSCYPTTCWKVLCDVFPTMSIEKTVHCNSSGCPSGELSEEDHDNGFIPRWLHSQPKSSFVFKFPFLSEGIYHFLNGLKGEKSELEKQYRCLFSLPEDEKFCILEKEKHRFLAYQMNSDDRYKALRCLYRLEKLDDIFRRGVGQGEYNLMLFEELGKGKLCEEILPSLEFLQRCSQAVSAINKEEKKDLTAEEKKSILDLFCSCHWTVKDKFLYLLDDFDHEPEDNLDDVFETLLASRLSTLQPAIASLIEMIENPEKEFSNDIDSFFDSQEPPIVDFTLNSKSLSLN